MKKAGFAISVVLCLVLLSTKVFAFGTVTKSRGQIVYASASYITGGVSTASRLVIRNLDPNNSITVNSVDFYDPDGVLVFSFPQAADGSTFPKEIDPLASISVWAHPYVLVPEGVYPSPSSLGRHSFLVDWEADRVVNAPSMGVVVAIWGVMAGIPFSDIEVIGSQVIKEKWWTR